MEATDKIEAAVNSLLIMDEPSVQDEAQQENPAPETELEAQETEAPEAEEYEPEASEEVEADEDNTAQEQAPSKYTVKVDGKEVEVTLDDLKRSFSGQAYIQKGMQEAAEARKAATELYQTLQTEQAKFMQVVQTIQEHGFKAPPQAPDIAMMDKDPIGYMQAEARYRKEAAEFQMQQQQIQQTAMAQRQMQEKAMAEFVAEQSKLLQSRIPEFADPNKAREITGKIRSTATEAYGFTDDELGGIVDARHVQVLHDAMKWRELQAARTKQAPAAPKSIKPVARRPEPQQFARKKQIDAARKTGGKPEAFIDLLFK
ncbi:MAG: hypothetical protein RI906_3330 [Pseudomonadota bacterium]|jgi:hypothetical protein